MAVVSLPPVYNFTVMIISVGLMFCSIRWRITRYGISYLQARTAIGSGGWLGKGWMDGTQAQLQFIPEKSTDFLLGGLCRRIRPDRCFTASCAILERYIACFIDCSSGQTRFDRLLAGSLAMIIFTYCVCEYGYGRWDFAGGGCATAIYELWRHCADYLGRGLWHVNEVFAIIESDRRAQWVKTAPILITNFGQKPV